ncbi:hypothetical protein ACIRQQ_48210 [Streptomyces fuscichromogenes]|uniref:hypothetical protein n=1 Tax=Streptomyces fuscichromogenes TaxID=1324013 RepID=UPI0037FF3831
MFLQRQPPPSWCETAPFAIGMADEIGDSDAITYAARFYASVANGHSVQAAHDLGRAAVELAGLPDHELPTLACAVDVDSVATFLVKPPQ